MVLATLGTVARSPYLPQELHMAINMVVERLGQCERTECCSLAPGELLASFGTAFRSFRAAWVDAGRGVAAGCGDGVSGSLPG